MTLEEQIEKRQEQQTDFKLLGKILRYLRPHIFLFSMGLLLNIVCVVIFSFEPRIIGMAVDFIDQGNYEKVIFIGILYLIASIIGVTTIYFGSIMISKVGHNIVYDIRNDVFSHIANLSINQLNSIPVGKLVSRVTNDTAKIMNLFINVFASLLRGFITLIVIIVNVYISAWSMGLILTAYLPLIFAAIFIFRRISRGVFRDNRKAISTINGFLAENLSGMPTTQIFNQETRKLDEFDEVNNHLLKTSLRQVRFFSLYRPTFFFFYATALLAVISVSTILAIDGQISHGMVTTFYLFTSQFFNPVQDMAEQFNTLQESFSGVERVTNLMEVKPEVLDLVDSVDVDRIEGKIEFRNVWFAYIEEEWILKDVSFIIERGEMAAFVGATGAGKSTIISLITRNYEVQKGQIFIDDIPIEKYTMRTLREHIGEMLQDVFLFAGTVSENVALFNKEATEAEIIKACAYVGASSFIEKLPNGYHEMIYERGNNFSMGQRQLLSFARVVLYNPNIILLDEATANIDTETEALIQSSLEKIMSIGTMIVVAHRLSTIKKADKIFVLSKGVIIETGNHQQLLKKRGTYYSLYKLQNMEKKTDEI